MSCELHNYDSWFMKCPRCGEYFDEDKGKCPKCGWPVVDSTHRVELNEQRAVSKEEKEVKI